MIESWLLLICNSEKYQNEASLPIFSKKDNALAKLYYAPKKPGDQLKDLRENERTRLDIESNRNFCTYCAENLSPVVLQKISGSFALLKEQVDAWPFQM